MKVSRRSEDGGTASLPPASAERHVSARLILVRHGRSAHVHDGRWIDRAGVVRYLEAYDAAGIDGAGPPPSLVRAAADAHHLLASDLPRALASAAVLAPGREVVSTPLLREMPLPVPALPLRLPLMGWAMAIHLRWMGAIALGRPAVPPQLDRATEAAAWLDARIAGGETALAVTHGAFRWLLARTLAARGWRPVPGPRRYHPWSAWAFERGALGAES